MELCFADTYEKANVIPIGICQVIVWPSVYSPNSVEDSAPINADAYRFLGEPRRTLSMSRNMEKVEVQYYRLKRESV